MQWREKLAILLGAASPFSIASGADADTRGPAWLDSPQPTEINKDQLVFVDPAHRNRLIQLAGHSSHSSHSSHASGYGGHSSHYSGSTYSAPDYSPPVYSPPAPPATSPNIPSDSAPKTEGLLSTPTSSESAESSSSTSTTEARRFTKDELSDIIQKVQIALLTRGFDPGPVDGVYSEKMKMAIGQFQTANGLKVTNLMDLKTLRSLNVVQ